MRTFSIPLPLLALACVAFSIGSSEYVIMGLLPSVAQDFDVTIDKAGLLITGYALSVVIGAPMMTILTARLPRKMTLVVFTLTFMVGNLLCALSTSYTMLMSARIMTAFCHGTFFGIGAVVAARLAPRDQRASAIALMFTGLTLANVLGVPLGTALGQYAGWRATFWAVTTITGIAIATLIAWLPAHIPVAPVNICRECRVLGNIRVLWPLVASTLASAALFCVLTYITPILSQVTGISARATTGMLCLFGIALTVGSTLGGKLGNRNVGSALCSLFFMLSWVFIAMTQTLYTWLPMLVTIFFWGVLSFALVPLLQTLIVDQAETAPNLASTLNHSAFNLGNAVGAWLGSIALRYDYPLTFLPWLSLAITLVAWILVLWGTRYYGQPSPCPQQSAA